MKPSNGRSDPRSGGALRIALLTALVISITGTAHAQNAIVLENQLTGNPSSEWDISGAGDLSIQGFATDISVNKGETVRFKIDTDASAYTIDIYRMGYYGGLGARKVATVLPSATLPGRPSSTRWRRSGASSWIRAGARVCSPAAS